MVQKAWGMPKEEIKKYIEFDNMFRCIVGGDKCLTVSVQMCVVCNSTMFIVPVLSVIQPCILSHLLGLNIFYFNTFIST